MTYGIPKYRSKKNWTTRFFMQPIRLNGRQIRDAYSITGHTGGIRAMIGWQGFIITGSDDTMIKIWDASTGSCIRTLEGHAERILCLEMWNGYLVSGGADSTVRIWDIVSGKCKKVLQDCSCNVNSLASTPGMLFAGGKDGNIYTWTNRYRYRGKLSGHNDWVNKLLVYNDNYLISCSDDKSIKIWEIATKQCTTTLTGHSDGICAICYYGSTLISAGSDFSIQVWDLRTGTRVTKLFGHVDVVTSLCVFNNQYLISTDMSSLVIVWDIKNKFRHLYDLTLHSGSVYGSMIFNNLLYTCSKDGSVVRWPSIQYFPELVTLLTKSIKEMSGNQKNTSDELREIQYEDYVQMQEENQRLITEQQSLKEQLKDETSQKKQYLKELIGRFSELNSLRTEICEVRKELTRQNARMERDMSSLSVALTLPFSSIKRDFIRTEGKHAFVWHGRWYESPVAVKSFKKGATDYDGRYDCLKLAERWCYLRHPNIVPLYGIVFNEKQSVSLVMELCPGSLQDVMQYCQRKRTLLSIQWKVNMLQQIAKAVSFLHQQKPAMAHGSICPSNVLLTASLTPRLTDIGTASVERWLCERKYDGVFVAPEEQAIDATSSTAGDVFSIGRLILYVLRDGKNMTEESVKDLSDIDNDLVRMMVQRYCNSSRNNRPSIDIVVKDLESYKQRVNKQSPSRVSSTLNLIYDKSTGCYLF